LDLLLSLELFWSLGFGAWDFRSWGFHSIVPPSFGFDVAIELMKAIALLLTVSAALALSGCATNQGAASEQYDTTYGTGRGNPASPTFRPGMNPDDIRDPTSMTRPIEAPPTTPP
jgi:hypothetical protein